MVLGLIRRYFTHIFSSNLTGNRACLYLRHQLAEILEAKIVCFCEFYAHEDLNTYILIRVLEVL
jgi:hypothetical protein